LIIEDSEYIENGNLLTVLPISSNLQHKQNLDIFLQKDERNRMFKDSLIKTQQISSFDKNRFIKFIGMCDDIVYNEVKNKVRKYLSV
jgi:mRNA-degrading endonuclease toxin of MazEF toxin-antitoxin module